MQEGHGHKFAVEGRLYRFQSRLVHDDSKPLDRWAASQSATPATSTTRIAHAPHAGGSSFKDRLRRAGLMPLAAGALAYARAGGPLRGRAALRYAYERVVFESLLAMRLMGEGEEGGVEGDPTAPSEALQPARIGLCRFCRACTATQ